MTDNILLTCMLIAPGYFSILIIEMLTSYKEKPLFDKLLDSLIYSLVIWLTFGVFTRKLPTYYLTKVGFEDFVGFKIILFLAIVYVYGLLMIKNKNKKWLFNYAEKKEWSIKTSHNVPLFEDIFNDTNKPIGSVEVRTLDGYTYYGRNRENKRIVTGTHPYAGDISFVCELASDKDGNKTPYKDDELETGKLILRTYIPKENIKFIRYEEEL